MVDRRALNVCAIVALVVGFGAAAITPLGLDDDTAAVCQVECEVSKQWVLERDAATAAMVIEYHDGEMASVSALLGSMQEVLGDHEQRIQVLEDERNAPDH